MSASDESRLLWQKWVVMIQAVSPGWHMALLLAVGISLAPCYHTWYLGWSGNRMESASLLETLLGDSRRMFANHFFIQADVYFHKSYYPSIFDQAPMGKSSELIQASQEDDSHTNTSSHAAQEHVHSAECEHNDLPVIFREPVNWIDRFGRNFIMTQHVHLEADELREILPWLKLSSDLDPYRVQTYVVTAYWLRRQLGKAREAEQFLRQGLRYNPRNVELLFELGAVYDDDLSDAARARNLWHAALRIWDRANASAEEKDVFLRHKITFRLARLEERAGHFTLAIQYYEMAKEGAPDPKVIQAHIEKLKASQGDLGR